MKFFVSILLAVVVCYVHGEKCVHIDDCSLTTCYQTTVHSHIACNKGYCTCEEEAKACLSAKDCVVNARCIGSSGHLERFHCVDGGCRCL